MSVMTLEKLAAMMQDGFKKSRIYTDASIEKLAVKVRDGFAGQDFKFQKIDERFDSLEQRFDVKLGDLRAEMNDRFDDVDEEIRGIHRATDAVSARVTKLENRSVVEFFRRLL